MQSHTIHKNKLGWSFKNIDIWKVNVTVYLHSHMLSSSSGSITLNHLYLNSWVIPDGLINIFIPLLIDLLTFSQFSSVAQSSQHARPPCPSPTPRVHPNSCASSQWCHPAILSSVVPVFSCPQPLPASESFPMSQLFAWGGQSIGVSASASVLPKSLSIGPSKEHPGLISFRMAWLDLLAVQGTLKSLLQHHSSEASILWHSAFFTVQLSHPYMTTGKTTPLTRRTFVGKVIALLFNMLCRLVITFLPRSKRLLISWLQSPSAVILEPQKIKSDTVSTVSPIYLPWSDGTRCHDLCLLNVEL